MFSRLASMISICLFFHSLQADMLISVMLMKNKHVHAIKAVSFLCTPAVAHTSYFECVIKVTA